MTEANALDCSTPAAARRTTALLLKMDEERMVAWLREAGLPVGPSAITYLREILLPTQEAVEGGFDVVWFHATRVADPDAFVREGILTKREMRARLMPWLTELAEGLQRAGDYRNGFSAAAKQWINDEGPFGFLFRSLALHAPGATHSYTEAPELVEDLAGALLGGNEPLLVDRFRARTTPCVVRFRGRGDLDELARALWYVFRVDRGDSETEAAYTANTCFNGMGRSIRPDEIVMVERLG